MEEQQRVTQSAQQPYLSEETDLESGPGNESMPLDQNTTGTNAVNGTNFQIKTEKRDDFNSSHCSSVSLSREELLSQGSGPQTDVTAGTNPLTQHCVKRKLVEARDLCSPKVRAVSLAPKSLSTQVTAERY